MVKMTFREDVVDSFKAFFASIKVDIRNFDGCNHLELWQDAVDSNIFFTYSHWRDATALNHYRNSDFFRNTWQQTRKLFSAKAEAWSVNQVEILP